MYVMSCVCVYCRQFLSMMRALLHLAEQMHYSEVMALLATPLKHCPEVLFLNLIECMVSTSCVAVSLHH